MRFFDRTINGRVYRVAVESIWSPKRRQPVSRQVILGPANAAPVVDLAKTQNAGTRRIGDVGALLWVAEQLGVVDTINEACGDRRGSGASVGEMALAVAVQRACSPGGKQDLSGFLQSCLPRVSCLRSQLFTGQSFHRLAQRVDDAALDDAQVRLAKAAVDRFGLKTDVLAFDSTNFDTYIATTTSGDIARRGHAKSKRHDLRVVGLGVMVSEVGHVPLLHRTYPGNESDQGLLEDCLENLRVLHEKLDADAASGKAKKRTLVRDGGFWSPQLELDLDETGYYSLISLPLQHKAAQKALAYAAEPRRMKSLRGALHHVRAARLRVQVGDLTRTLVVVDSEELRRGQKRGIAVALRKAKLKLSSLQKQASKGRLTSTALEQRVKKTLAREHLSQFVVTSVTGPANAPRLRWRVDGSRRRTLENTRLGRRVLCTDRHSWSTERIVSGFRGQWTVEEFFRRAKRGGVVPWGPSHQWADASLRFHTFCVVLGLMLVALARQALNTDKSAKAVMAELSGVAATMLRTATGDKGRRPTVFVGPQLTPLQRRAVRVFQLDRWAPSILSTMQTDRPQPEDTTHEPCVA